MWPYITPGIADDLFERLPGIPMTQREIRLLILSHLRLTPKSVLWDIGAGTGTIPVEVGLICPQGKIFAIERDEEVVGLIRRNCDRFGVRTVQIIEGSAPECLAEVPLVPDRVCIEGGKSVKAILQSVWGYLKPNGRIVTTAASLETLYQISESFSDLQVRNIEMVQASVNRLQKRGNSQVLVGCDPIFVMSGEKIDD
jgi:cobalt-precorrin-6B (C15)-methyltransferase